MIPNRSLFSESSIISLFSFFFSLFLLLTTFSAPLTHNPAVFVHLSCNFLGFSFCCIFRHFILILAFMISHLPQTFCVAFSRGIITLISVWIFLSLFHFSPPVLFTPLFDAYVRLLEILFCLALFRMLISSYYAHVSFIYIFHDISNSSQYLSLILRFLLHTSSVRT